MSDARPVAFKGFAYLLEIGRQLKQKIDIFFICLYNSIMAQDKCFSIYSIKMVISTERMIFFIKHLAVCFKHNRLLSLFFSEIYLIFCNIFSSIVRENIIDGIVNNCCN